MSIRGAMNQSEFLAIAFNLFEAREKSRAQSAIGFGFGFASYWLKNWREIFKAITKCSNRNRLNTCYISHLLRRLWSPKTKIFLISSPDGGFLKTEHSHLHLDQ